MNDALADWVGRLDKQPLPILRANHQLLWTLSGAENADMGRLADAIELAPGICILLLRHINGLRHKHLRTEITTPRHALMMLGIQKFRELLRDIPCIDDLSSTAQQRVRRSFSQSYHAAYQARDWGRINRDLNTEELFTAAQLHNVGEMLLQIYAPDEVGRVYKLMRQKDMEPEEAQYVVFGFGFDQLSLELAELWLLPTLLRDSLHGENAQLHRARNIMLAAQLSNAVNRGWYTSQVDTLIEEIAEFLYADIASTATLLHRNAVEAAAASLNYNVAHPASQLLLPAEARGEFLQQATNSLETNSQGSVVDFCLAPQRAVLLRVLRTLNKPEKRLPLKNVFELVLEGMHDGLGLNRVVFAMRTPDKGQLRAASIIGSDNDPVFNRFVIDLNSNNLFERLLQKQQSLWLDENNREKFHPLIPLNFHRLTHNDSFFVMSLFVKNKPIGIFYADRHTRACRLDQESYRRFRQLVTMTAHHLAKRGN